MTTYQIEQINLSYQQIDVVNSSSSYYPAFYKKYLDTTMRPTRDRVLEAIDMYEIVAEIEATDLDDVFNIGNIGPESSIKRFSRMHSISVGDIITDLSTGKKVFVASFGFEEI